MSGRAAALLRASQVGRQPRHPRPKPASALVMLQPGDTLVIYKPDRVARSMKELLVLLEDQLHGRGIGLHILTGICWLVQ